MLRSSASGIHVPCLMISGTSLPALQEVTAGIARELPDARLVPIEGSGHVTYVEAPDVFARAVAAFAHEQADAATTR